MLRIAQFLTVAERAVRAVVVPGDVHTTVILLIAGVQGAVHLVVAIRRFAGQAAFRAAALFSPIAEQTVVTKRVVLRMVATVPGFITTIVRTEKFIDAIARFAGQAAFVQIADFIAITELVVAAK